MKVILKQDVSKVGGRGELIEVSDGYGRNFLIGRGLAEEATPGRIREYEEQQKTQKLRDEKRLKLAEETKKKIGGKIVSIKVNAGEGGKLFGSVTGKDVSEALKKQHIDIDKRKITIQGEVTGTGVYEAVIKVHPTVTSKIKVSVVAE